MAELLAEVVLGIESATARDLRYPQIAGLEQARGFLEPFLFHEVTQQTSGHAVKASGYVLPRVPELSCHCFNGDFFICAQAAANCLDQSSKETVHDAPRGESGG